MYLQTFAWGRTNQNYHISVDSGGQHAYQVDLGPELMVNVEPVAGWMNLLYAFKLPYSKEST